MLGVGVEGTHLPEVVLDRGRRLELYLADVKSRSGVRERINLAFMKAFSGGPGWPTCSSPWCPARHDASKFAT